MKVLIADNAEETREVLGRMLSDEGYECTFVRKGSEVIDRIYIDLPDIIILDMRLSDASTIEILEKLKTAPSTRDIPIILIASRKSRQKLAKAYELGAHDYISRPYFKEEIMARIRNIAYACERVKELEKLLHRDYLTGLYNRGFFMDIFLKELAWSVRYKEPLSLLMFDIDHFKKINDTYGHGCGDEILKQVANALLSVLRTEDIVARYGGEEFIVLFPNTDSNGAVTVAEKLRLTIQNSDFHCEHGDIHLNVTISIGVATYDGNVDLSYDRFIGQADNALYTAKERGRNMVVVSS